MEKELAINQTIRKNAINLLNDLTDDQITKIPDGFNNHILWNFGHMVVTQQILCYKLSLNAFTIDSEIIDRYRKGSTPTEVQDIAKEKALLIQLATETQQTLEQDLKKKDFTAFEKYETSFGYTLNSIEDAVRFNNVHEGLHLGYMMAQRRALSKA